MILIITARMDIHLELTIICVFLFLFEFVCVVSYSVSLLNLINRELIKASAVENTG